MSETLSASSLLYINKCNTRKFQQSSLFLEFILHLLILKHQSVYQRHQKIFAARIILQVDMRDAIICYCLSNDDVPPPAEALSTTIISDGRRKRMLLLIYKPIVTTLRMLI